MLKGLKLAKEGVPGAVCPDTLPKWPISGPEENPVAGHVGGEPDEAEGLANSMYRDGPNAGLLGRLGLDCTDGTNGIPEKAFCSGGVPILKCSADDGQD